MVFQEQVQSGRFLGDHGNDAETKSGRHDCCLVPIEVLFPQSTQRKLLILFTENLRRSGMRDMKVDDALVGAQAIDQSVVALSRNAIIITKGQHR